MPKKSKKKSSRDEFTTESGEDEEIEIIRQRIENEAPERGYQGKSDGALNFHELPLCKKTLKALTLAKLQIATDIQAAAIPHALAGRDV